MAYIVLIGRVTASNSGFSEFRKGSFILGSIKWPGRSGREYWYEIYPRHWRFGARHPGNYIYAVESAPSRFLPLYIGQTDDLDRRLLEHDSEFNLFRATHLCAHSNYYDYGASGRLMEERDLIELWQPACNGSTHRACLSVGVTQGVFFDNQNSLAPVPWSQTIKRQIDDGIEQARNLDCRSRS